MFWRIQIWPKILNSYFICILLKFPGIFQEIFILFFFPGFFKFWKFIFPGFPGCMEAPFKLQMSKFVFLHAKQHSIEPQIIRLCVLTKPTKYMICDKSVQYKWYISFHFPLYGFMSYIGDYIYSSRIRHHSESDRMLAKLVAIQVNKLLNRSTVFICHNTGPGTS